jgi:hypothetical protein
LVTVNGKAPRGLAGKSFTKLSKFSKAPYCSASNYAIFEKRSKGFLLSISLNEIEKKSRPMSQNL